MVAALRLRVGKRLDIVAVQSDRASSQIKITQMGRDHQGAFTAAQLGRAIQQWDEPSHPEHAEDGHTVWRLFNAATEALKPTGDRINHDLVRQRSERISGFLDEVAAL